MNPERQERAHASGRPGAYRESRFTSRRLQDEPAYSARPLDLHERVVVHAKDIEDVIPDRQASRPKWAREIQQHRYRGRLKSHLDGARARLTAASVAPQPDVLSQHVQQPLASLDAASLSQSKILGHLGR